MPKPKKRRMTIEQYVKVTDWLRSNKNRIMHVEELSQIQTAKIASTELGFEISLSTIQQCGKVAEIRWPKSPPPTPPPPIDREAIIILIGALHGLYLETCGSAPQNLTDLKSAYVQEQQKAKRQITNPDIEVEKIDISTHDKPNQFLKDEGWL